MIINTQFYTKYRSRVFYVLSLFYKKLKNVSYICRNSIEKYSSKHLRVGPTRFEMYEPTTVYPLSRN